MMALAFLKGGLVVLILVAGGAISCLVRPDAPLNVITGRDAWQAASSVSSLAWSADGEEVFAVVDPYRAEGPNNIYRFTPAIPGSSLKPLEGEYRLATAVATRPHDGGIMIGTDLGQVYDTPADQVRWHSNPTRLEKSNVRHLFAQPDGRTLVGQRSLLTLLDARGNLSWSLPTPDGVRSLDSANGTVVVGTHVNRVLQIDLESGTVQRTIVTRICGNSVAISPDGRWIAVGGLDGSLTLWDVATGELQWLRSCGDQPILTLSISPDGSHIAAGGMNDAVMVWKISGELHAVFDVAPTLCVKFSPSGDRLACSTDQGKIHVLQTNAARM